LTATQAAWLLAGGILGAAPLLNRLPLTLGALVGAAFAWRGWLIFRRQRLPARGLLIFVTLGTVLAVLFHYRTLFGQQAGVALLAAFIALKQLEARAPRDGVTIVLLGFFLILAQFFENQSLPVVAVMAVQLVVLTAALASLQDAEATPRALLKLAALMLAQAAPWMLILFVLFPRISGPLWGAAQRCLRRPDGAFRRDGARHDPKPRPLRRHRLPRRIRRRGAAEKRSLLARAGIDAPRWPRLAAG
jgi:hypothetical protein